MPNVVTNRRVLMNPPRSAPFVGALDAYTTGLAGVWSVARRLLTDYTGNLIRIRRSSDDTEQNIGYVADGSLDAAAITAFVGSNSAYVTKVYDQNSNAQDMVQATASHQPLIVSSGSLQTLAGLPSMVFDGSNDTLLSNTLTGAGVREYSVIMRSATALWNNYGAALEVSTDGDRLGIFASGSTGWDSSGLIPAVRKNGAALTPYAYDMTTIDAAMVLGVQTRLSTSAALVQMGALGVAYFINYNCTELVAWSTAGTREAFESNQKGYIGL